MNLAQTLACSLILSRIGYCNAVLHGAPSGTIIASCSKYRTKPQVLRRSVDHPLLKQRVGCRWIERISYKLAVLKVWNSRYGVRQHRRISVGTSEHVVAPAVTHAVIGRSVSRCAVQTQRHRQTISQLEVGTQLSVSRCHQQLLWHLSAFIF